MIQRQCHVLSFRELLVGKGFSRAVTVSGALGKLCDIKSSGKIVAMFSQ